MVRTQIYLTDRQRAELAAISKTSGKKQSELIREAVDQLISELPLKEKVTIAQMTAEEVEQKFLEVVASVIHNWKNNTKKPSIEEKLMKSP